MAIGQSIEVNVLLNYLLDSAGFGHGEFIGNLARLDDIRWQKFSDKQPGSYQVPTIFI